ncbi:MAG: hypothetical protein HY074_13495, partial [Deltaproteobacteria bacterium]|nr:hypothetical protein [Deltaproteobacteria bacterium]
LGAFATATVLFALLAAVRLLPIAEALSVNARAVDALEHLSFFELLQCLTLRTGELQDLRWEAHEYQYYVGTVPLLLALMPWLLAPRNGLRLWPLAALGLFGAIFALGNFAPWSPYAALHLLPVFRSLHVTPRFLVFTTLSIGVLAGAGLDAMVLHVGKRRARRWVGPATLAMVALCTLDLLLTGNRALQTAFPRAPKGVARDNAFSQQAWHGDASSALRWLPMYEFFLQNHGMSRAYGDALYGSGHVKPMGSPEYRGEAYVTSAEGHATIESWSPNRVVVATDGPHEAMLVLNQNFGPGWQAEGRALESHRGLVATRVANGPQRVTFFFRPSLLWLGFALSGFGLLFSLALVPRTPPSRSPASSRPKRPFMAINRAKNITR